MSRFNYSTSSSSSSDDDEDAAYTSSSQSYDDFTDYNIKYARAPITSGAGPEDGPPPPPDVDEKVAPASFFSILKGEERLIQRLTKLATSSKTRVENVFARFILKRYKDTLMAMDRTDERFTLFLPVGGPVVVSEDGDLAQFILRGEWTPDMMRANQPKVDLEGQSTFASVRKRVFGKGIPLLIGRTRDTARGYNTKRFAKINRRLQGNYAEYQVVAIKSTARGAKSRLLLCTDAEREALEIEDQGRDALKPSGISMHIANKPLGRAMLALAHELIARNVTLPDDDAKQAMTSIMRVVNELKLERLYTFDSRSLLDIDIRELLRTDARHEHSHETMVDAIMAAYFARDPLNIRSNDKRRWVIVEAARAGKIKSLRALIAVWQYRNQDIIDDAFEASLVGNSVNLEMANYLVHDVGANARSWRAMRAAVSKNSIDLVAYLLDHGASVDQLDRNPIDQAAERGYRELLYFMMSKSTRPKREVLNSALEAAAYSGESGTGRIRDVITALLESGADKSVVNLEWVQDDDIRAMFTMVQLNDSKRVRVDASAQQHETLKEVRSSALFDGSQWKDALTDGTLPKHVIYTAEEDAAIEEIRNKLENIKDSKEQVDRVLRKWEFELEQGKMHAEDEFVLRMRKKNVEMLRREIEEHRKDIANSTIVLFDLINKRARGAQNTGSGLDVPHEIIKRDDGLTILLLHTSLPGAISHVQVDVKVGDDNEARPDEREAAHFLEHLVASLLRSRTYKGEGTKRFAEEHGIESNASTSSVRTSYYMNGHVDRLQMMIDMQVGAIADFLELFEGDRGKRYALEESAVQRELAAKIDTPEFRLYEEFNRIVYGAHPRAVSQRTDMVNIMKMRSATVRTFFAAHYVPRNMLVTVATSEPKERVLAMLAPYSFARTSNVVAVPRPSLTQPFPRGLHVHALELKDAHTVRMTFAWPLPVRRFDDDAFVVRAISNLLTGGFSSRLLNRLRVVDGAVYSVQAYGCVDETDAGFSNYQIETSANAADVAEVIAHTLDELATLCRDGPTDDEMEKYRLRIRTARERRMLSRSPSGYVDDYAEQVLFTGAIVETNARRFKLAERVSKFDVMRVCRSIFGPAADGRRSNLLIVYGAPKNMDDDIRHVVDAAAKKTLVEAAAFCAGDFDVDDRA